MLKVLGTLGCVGLLLSATVVQAQTPAATPAPPTCTAAEHRQFDFWIGNWTARYVSNGKEVTGSNRIAAALNHCVIIENFDGTPGSPLKGYSHSVYDRTDGRWKQTWVDNSGGYLDFVGGWEGDRMVLTRTATRQGKTFRQRMVWFDIRAEAFTWHWERSDDDGKTWQINWKIDYRRLP
jgi:hypothetical protein